MSNYIAELESELIRAGRRHQQQRSRLGGRLRPGFSSLITALGAAFAIAVAAIALVLVGHSQLHNQPAPATDAPPATEGLVSRLAVLRRPQTAADRTLPSQLVVKLTSRSHSERVILPSLTHLLATLPNGLAALGENQRSLPTVRIFLIVTRPPRSHAVRGQPSNQHGALASIAWAIGQKSSGVGPGIPAAFLYREQAMRPLSVDTYNVSIAPDGVARVRWSFVDGTIYPTVRSNIAVGLNIRRVGTAPEDSYTIKDFDVNALTGVAWYGPDRHLIASFGSADRYPFGVPTPVAQINLTAPNARARAATGIVDVLAQSARRRISVTARGLAPNTPSDSYAIWLYRSPSQTKLLGFVNRSVGSDGHLHAGGPLPQGAGRYSEILITLEHRPNPTTPGMIVLRGRLILG